MSTDQSPHQDCGNTGGTDELAGVLIRLNSDSESEKVEAERTLQRFFNNGGRLSQQWIDQLFQILDIRSRGQLQIVNSIYYVASFQSSSVRRNQLWKIGVYFLLVEIDRNLDEVSEEAGMLLMAMKEVVSEHDIRPIEFTLPLVAKYRDCEREEYRSAARELMAEWGFSRFTLFI